MDHNINVSFTCQRCRQPITLSQDFSSLTELTLAELALPIYESHEVKFDGLKLDKEIKKLKIDDSNNQSQGFTIVGKASSSQTQKPSPLKVASNLFELLSSNSDIDHPLCEECTDYLSDQVDEYLDRTEKQIVLYKNLLEDSKKQDDSTDQMEEELKQLHSEESRLLNELSDVRKEKKEALKSLHIRQEERSKLDAEEERYWREFCAYRCQVIPLEDESRSLKSRISCTNHQLEKLRQSNIFNATFRIWYIGHFGTINNLRLGRLPSVPVHWSEINAAWGQTVLLLASLAKKVGLTFTKYELVPYGNNSFIRVLSDKKELPLYGSGGIRFLWDHKFDAGMSAFLECAAEFKHFVETSGFEVTGKESKKKSCLPYRIIKHFLEDNTTGQMYSIKMQFNSEEHWTKALKFLLTNLKWAITWVSSPTFPKNVEKIEEK